MANKAVFFDRDGTLNEEVHFLHKIEDFVWTEEAREAIKFANDQGYLVIVVTNQSGIARGYYPEADVQIIHNWMNEELAKIGAHLDAIYYCPHHPEGVIPQYTKECTCRKPGPKMVNDACNDLNIDKSQSVLIGDAERDLICAKNAGVRGVRYTGGSLLALLKSAINN